MAETKVDQIKDLIEQAETIGLITHREGDADAFGSTIALAEILKVLGKKPVIFSNEPLLPMVSLINPETDYQPVADWQKVDLLITLDANGQDRFTVPEIIQKATKEKVIIVSIDHHEPGNLAEVAKIYWCEPQISSTSEMVLALAQAFKLKINKLIANLLLLGIFTDTKSLQNPNTNADSFAAVAELVKLGGRVSVVSQAIFSGRTIPSLQLLGLAIKNLKLDPRTGVGITILAREGLNKLALEDESTSGIANFLDQLKEVGVIVVLEEREGGMVRGSMRSNGSDIDVNEVAKQFGGGGHTRAAGFLTKGNPKEIAEKILGIISKN